jgi:hypothetical protein
MSTVELVTWHDLKTRLTRYLARSGFLIANPTNVIVGQTIPTAGTLVRGFLAGVNSPLDTLADEYT